jgi:hypothetical protein
MDGREGGQTDRQTDKLDVFASSLSDGIHYGNAKQGI